MPAIIFPLLKNHQNISVALACISLLFGMAAHSDK